MGRGLGRVVSTSMKEWGGGGALAPGRGGRREEWFGKRQVCVCVVRARDVLDVGFGVPGVVQRLFLGGCPRRSPRQKRVVEIVRCQPSGVLEGDSRATNRSSRS